MEIDQRYPYLMNAKEEKFQVLKPQEYADVPILDDDGNPTGEFDRVELPRELDEKATLQAYNGG